MCLRGCMFVILIIFSIFSFLVGGLIGKYYYHRHHTSFEADDAAWMWKNSSSFFSIDDQFFIWGFVAVGIFITFYCILLAIVQATGMCVCFAVKAPFRCGRCIWHKARGTGKKEKKTKEEMKKKKKSKKSKQEEEEESLF